MYQEKRGMWLLVQVFQADALHMGLSWQKMSDFWWTDKLVDELITLYEANPCLCDTNLREYSNRD